MRGIQFGLLGGNITSSITDDDMATTIDARFAYR
jgi:hypothetical protein